MSIPRIKFKESYEKLLSEYKSPVSFLEIGLDTGKSLLEWKSFFSEGSRIYGVDITFKNIQINLADFDIFEIDSRDKSKADLFFKDIKFDIIIDDGGPQCHLETFEVYHPRLKKGGIYIIETFRKPSWIEVYKTLKESYKQFEISYKIICLDRFVFCKYL